jgi:hypothetical protein
MSHNAIYSRYDVRAQLQAPLLPLSDLFDEDDEYEHRPSERPEIVLNPFPYDEATQDEDYRHFRLPVASYQDNNGVAAILTRSDPAVELLLFPVLYPHGRGQYVWGGRDRVARGKGTRLQDAQKKLGSLASHFRDDHY